MSIPSKWDNPIVIYNDAKQPLSERTDVVLYFAEKKGLLDDICETITPAKLRRTFRVAVRKNPKILECTLESVLSCIQEAASLGLEFGNTLGHAYLIPFYNRKIGGQECTLLLGYRGLIDLARRRDNIDLRTRCVYVGDEFDYSEGDDNYIKHRPSQDPGALFLDRDVTHVYLIAERGGHVIARSVWTRAQIERHKEQYSKGHERSDSPWKTAWSQMARKTLIRESINRGEIPVSSEIQRLSVREEHAEIVPHVRGHILQDIPEDRKISFEDEPAEEIIDAEYSEPSEQFTKLKNFINLTSDDGELYALTPELDDALKSESISEAEYNELKGLIDGKRGGE